MWNFIHRLGPYDRACEEPLSLLEEPDERGQIKKDRSLQ